MQTAQGEHWLALTTGGNFTMTGPSLVMGLVSPYLGISAPGKVIVTGSSEIDLGSTVKPTTAPANGLLFEANQAQMSFSGPSSLDGPVFVGTDPLPGAPGDFPAATTPTASVIAQARADAFAGSACAAGLANTGVSIASGASITQSATIVGADFKLNVVNLHDVVLNGNSVLKLQCSGCNFIVNITGKLVLNSKSQIIGPGELNVLLNVTGIGPDVAMTGGTSHGVPNTQINGILLAPNRTVGLHPGEVNGTIIAKEINITSGGEIISHFN